MRLARLAFLLILPALPSAAGQTPAPTLSPEELRLANQQDLQRTMEMLHLKALRPGVSPDPKSAHPVNYDEGRGGPTTPLPGALRLNNGAAVTTARQWTAVRRPELFELFDREILGRVPAHTPGVRWEVASTEHTVVSFDDNGVARAIPVMTKHLLGHVDNSADPAITVAIELDLTTPEKALGRVPVMMEFTYRFPPPRPGAPPRPVIAPPPGPTWQQQVLAQGWGYASLVPTTVQADNGAGLTAGIIGLCNHGAPRKPEDWGALRAWAWGAARALDYFSTDSAVDAKQVGLEGHSRYGKAALVAMAYDPRFAIAYISSSGMGGADLWRRSFGEQMENVAAASEYHWMAPNFLRYAADPLHAADLPVDQHELIALCAPRPVFIGAGATEGDGWTDAHGMFLAAVAASPVYTLLGRRGLADASGPVAAFPPIETPLIAGDLGFRQHTAGHTPAPNWPTFLTFAGRHLHGAPPAAPGAGSQP